MADTAPRITFDFGSLPSQSTSVVPRLPQAAASQAPATKKRQPLRASRKLNEGYHAGNIADGAARWRQDSTVGKLLAALRAASYLRAAAGYAGVSVGTVKVWIETGNEYLAQAGLTLDDEMLDILALPPEQQPYVHFIQEVDRTESTAEVNLVTSWYAATSEDWRAAERLLARRHSERWGERQQIQMESTSNVNVAATVDLSIDVSGIFASRLEALRSEAIDVDLVDEPLNE